MENFNPLDNPELKAAIDKYYPFLLEVKKRVIRTVIIFFLATFLGFLFYENIISILIKILDLDGVNIVFTSPFQFISLALNCGLAAGLIITLPLIAYQLLSFLKPALRPQEYKMLVKFLPVSLVLFIIGFAFGVYVMKWQIQIFVAQSESLGIGNALDVSSLLSTIIKTSAFLGLGFQLPIILFITMKVGLVKADSLRKRRMWIWLGSFLFAILLPADSILTDIILALPLIILFETTLLLYSLSNSKKGK